MQTDGIDQLQTGADLKVTITSVNTFIVYVKVLFYVELLNGIIFDSMYGS